MHWISYLWERARPLLLVLGAGVLFFALLRGALLLLYPAHFDSLTAAGLWQGFSQGVRFDLSVLVLFTAPMLLALAIPLRWGDSIRWRRFWLLLAGAPMLALWLLGFGDLGYFGEVGRHLGNELLTLGSEIGLFWNIAMESRRAEALALLIMVALFPLLWWFAVVRPGSRPLKRSVGLVPRVLVSLVLVAGCVMASRGLQLEGKPVSVIDAYVSGNEQISNLTLNGAFSAVNASLHSQPRTPRYFSPEALAAARVQYGVTGDNPFFKHYPDNQPSGRNVVVILLEGWSYRYLDGLAGSQHGATPFMDSLAQQSWVFDRFYAAGQRSIQGLQAVLTGIPLLPGNPWLGHGLELTNMTRIGALAGQAGYRTLMMQSSPRRSLRVDSVARSLGFTEYYGQEDVPLRRDYGNEAPRYGWDYDSLMFFKDQLDRLHAGGEPFFGFLFTGTTHEPFADPGAEFHVAPHDRRGLNGFLNTMRYTDWALEQFMAAAQDSDWFANTTFIFTADHEWGGDGQDTADMFHIPLIIHAPGQVPSARTDRLASQYDLLPTMVDVMGLAQPFSALGDSLLRPDESPDAWITQGDMLGVIEDGVLLRHTPAGRFDVQPAEVQDDLLHRAEHRLLLLYQLAAERLGRNLWVSEE